MKTRILVLSSLVIVFGCDKVERDWGKCNDVNKCQDGYQCNRDYRCVLKDAGLDAQPASDGSAAPAETAGDRPLALEAFPDAPEKTEDASGTESHSPVATVDAPVDMAPDGPGADARLTCGTDEDCPAHLPLCLNSLCVQCRSHDDCTGETDGGAGDSDDGSDGGATKSGFCNSSNLCVGCLNHKDCQDRNRPVCGADQECVACAAPAAPENACAIRDPGLPACHAANGTCEQCVRASDCRAKGDAGAGDAGGEGSLGGGVCSANKCVECTSKADCTADPARALCVNNACVGCGSAGPNACTGPKPLCATSGSRAGQCVECTSNAQCVQAASPICESNQCRGCRRDSECSEQAGICVLDGSCPKANAIVYAQSSSKCTSSNRGQGTLDFPYCDLDQAVATAVGVVRVIGKVVPTKALTVSRPNTPLLITGQSNSTAIINPPLGSTDPVVSITEGEVTLRDLTIAGGQAAGVSASAGIVHIQRCYVLDNAGTGIDVGNGVAFDIVNTVVAGNGGISNAGVSLGSYTGSGPARFAFNTVVNNGYGVVCGMGHTLTGILSNNNVVRDFNAECRIDSTASTAPPAFGSNFHLSSSSPCVNTGGPTCPADDIDGEARPKGNACDCGADEF